jgi:hypothetical protein
MGEAYVTTYEVRVTDPFGNTIRILDEFHSLQYARKVNNVGELSLDIKDDDGENVFLPENRIEVWRHKGDVAYLDMNAIWFIHTVTHYQSEDGSTTLNVEAHDQIGILPRRIIPYNEGNDTTQKQAPGDDVIKEIMRENFGSAASDTDRDLGTYLSIQGDVSAGPQVTIFCAKDNVYDIIKEIADTSYESGTFMAFDLIYNPNTGTFIFETFTGQRGADRSNYLDKNSIIIGMEYGSLSSATFVDSREDERNYIYAGAKDLVGIVPPQTAVNTASIGISPFHRKELFLNASQADDATELQDEANRSLEENKYRTRFEGELSQEFALKKYGELFDYGDKVTVSFMSKTYTSFVDAISVTLDNNGEKIDVVLVGADE